MRAQPHDDTAVIYFVFAITMARPSLFQDAADVKCLFLALVSLHRADATHINISLRLSMPLRRATPRARAECLQAVPSRRALLKTVKMPRARGRALPANTAMTPARPIFTRCSCAHMPARRMMIAGRTRRS